MTTDDNTELYPLLDYIKRSRGFDFGGYKVSTLGRRINKRMHLLNIDSHNDYIDYLEVHPEELNQLINIILINVTGFFRDEAPWEYLKVEILPRILTAKRPDETIRVWSTGCSSGEEPYSISMLLAGALGEEQYRERVKIYATDVDEDALNKARAASYTEKEMEGVPEDLRNKYFIQLNGSYLFNKELRRNVIFGRNDLIQDAPISRVDLLICRNTLMYFNAEAQAKILAHFHFALNDDGYLFLGKAEMLLTHTYTFSPINLKLRFFNKIPRVNPRERMQPMTYSGNEENGNHLFSLVRTRDLVFDTSPIAQLVIDFNNILIMANEQARLLFHLTSKEIGQPFHDLELSYRPAELRSIIQRAYAERSPIIVKDIIWPINGLETRFFDIRLQPLYDEGNRLFGVCVGFYDITQDKQLQAQLEHTNHELETALEELQSTNEELETTNEELHSTIEELETTNEELQSTNEELETMNEELQSTNEELQTINDELRQRTEELNNVNAFMESILTSVRAGMVVLNADLGVTIWNRKAEDLWGLREEDVQGRNFLTLDIGLPVEQLKRQFMKIMEAGTDYSETMLQARDRRGKEITCKVSCSPLFARDKKVNGIIALMEVINEDGN